MPRTSALKTKTKSKSPAPRKRTAKKAPAAKEFQPGVWYLLFLVVAALLAIGSQVTRLGFAQGGFQGPSTSGGVGAGAIGLDQYRNLSVGTSTPISDTKLFVLASTTASTGFAVKVVQPGSSQNFSHSGVIPGNPLLLIRNDGRVGIAGFIGDTSTSTVVIGGNTRIDGTLSATNIAGTWTGNLNAGYVTPGGFGSLSTTGNYSFPASLSVATSTPPSAGVLFVNGGVGVGTASPGYKMEVRDSVDIQLRLSSADTWAGLSFSDSAGNDQIYYNGANSTFAIGGGGANVANKKLHVDGGVTIGSGYDSTAPLTNGLVVEGIGRFAGTGGFSVGPDTGQNRAQISTSGFTRFAVLGTGNGYLPVSAQALSIGASYGDTAPPANGAIFQGSVAVGTSTPAYKLQVHEGGTGSVYMNVTNNDSGSTSGNGMVYGIDSSEHGYVWNYENTNIYLGTNNATRMIIQNDGKVRIGTTAPTYTLDVVSGGATTARFGTAASDTVVIGDGSGKLNVGTVDPIYTINGRNYATYMAGMVGVKEETTGVWRMPCGAGRCELTIDFDREPEGSDLWLFAKTTRLKSNWDKFAVLLTPDFNGRVWYNKDHKGKLTVHASPAEQAGTVEISYRLTAPRFDADKWSNYNTDEGMKGFIIND